MLLSTLAFMAASACGQQGSDMSNEKFATPKDAALYQAAAKGDLTQARQLLAEGASLNSRNARKMTPLDVAMVEGNRRALDSLLELGVDPRAVNAAGNTFQRYFFTGPRDPEVEKKVRAWLHDHGIAVEERRK